MARRKIKSSARKTSKIPSKVYNFGVYAPGISDEHKRVIHEQVFRGHLYRRERVEIETDRREQYRGIRRELSPDLSAVLERYVTAETAYKEARRSELSGIEKRDERRAGASEKVRLLKDELKAASQALKEAQTAADLLVKPLREEFSLLKRRRYLEKAIRPGDEWLLGNCPEGMDKEDFIKAQNKAIKTVGPRVKEHIKEALRVEFLEGDSTPVGKRFVETDGKSDAAISEARQRGCFTGTYQAIDLALEMSFKTSIYNPESKRFTQEGKVGTQITNVQGEPVTLDRVMAGVIPKISIRLVERIHRRTGTIRPLRGSRRKAKRVRAGKNDFVPQAAVARILLSGKGAESAHVYVDIPFNMARPFPKDAVLKWVYIVAKRVGTRMEYQLQFTIESEEFFPKGPVGDTAIAVNLGWRVLPDSSILAATTWDGSTINQILLPPKMQVDIQKANKLQGAADRLFDQARETFRTWIGEHPEVSEQLKSEVETKWNPETKREEPTSLYGVLKLSSLHQWRAHTKLRTVAWRFRRLYLTEDLAKSLWAKWRAARGVIDKQGRKELGVTWNVWRHRDPKLEQDLFDTWEVVSGWLSEQGVQDPAQQMAVYLDWWRVKDTHLINWAKGMILRLTRARKDFYRKIAARWSRQYDFVIFQEWDKSKTAEVPNPEDDLRTEQEVKANAIRQLVGASKLQEAAKQAFGFHRYIEAPKDRISTEHFGCGGISTPTLETRRVCCTKCGSLYDQDKNAVQHLYRERPGGDQTPVTARNNEETCFSEVAAAE
jgi:hypothetical protein